MRVQPVDARDVAARLVELTVGDPAGRVPDLAGPTVYGLDELTRSYLRARGRRRPMMPIRIPGTAGRTYWAGENLTLKGAQLGTRTWEDFLNERVQPRSARLARAQHRSKSAKMRRDSSSLDP